MIIDIIVVRDSGDNQGDDIVNPIIGSIPIAVLTGQSMIDSFESIYSISLKTQFRPNVEMGQLVEVHDIIQGSAWRGKIVEISHSKQGPEVFTDLEIERPVSVYP